jgi:hypothetical protein
MQWDIGKKTTLYVNGFHLDNFAFGFDSYVVYEDYEGQIDVARITMINLLFFNVTVTRWRKPF